MTSSRTILSDCEFVGVYDHMVESSDSTLREPVVQYAMLQDMDSQLESCESSLADCPFHMESSSDSAFCSLAGLDPRMYESRFEELE